MKHRIRPFVDAAVFSGLMTIGAFTGALIRSETALSSLGCATACQSALMLAAAFSIAQGARFWTPWRIELLSIPSYAAAVLAIAMVLERGIGARHAIDLALLAAFFVSQGRMFAFSIVAKLNHVPEPFHARILVSREQRPAL